MTQNLTKLSKEAAEIILSHPKSTRVRVISHYDADGITAAAIICKSLHRAGYDFHASLMRNPFDKGLEKVSKEKNELIIFTDMGSGQIDTIEKMKVKSIIIDLIFIFSIVSICPLPISVKIMSLFFSFETFSKPLSKGFLIRLV